MEILIRAIIEQMAKNKSGPAAPRGDPHLTPKPPPRVRRPGVNPGARPAPPPLPPTPARAAVKPAPPPAPRPQLTGNRIRQLLHSRPATMRTIFVLSEVLQPPISLRR